MNNKATTSAFLTFWTVCTLVVLLATLCVHNGIVVLLIACGMALDHYINEYNRVSVIEDDYDGTGND